MTTTAQPKKAIGAFSLAMLSVSAIISLRNLPSTALEGTRCIFYFALAALTFFIPVALACAELASGWPEQGGAYNWIKAAFGPKIGFLAIWLEWIESVIWLPTVLSFMAATTAYLINPSLSKNPLFVTALMLAYLWASTLINFRGMNLSSVISTLGVLAGSLFPAAILVGLSVWHISSHPQANQLDYSWHAFLPEANFGSLSTYTLILLGFCGMEIPAYHIQNVDRPQRNYPRAMLLATLLILAVSILGSLAIAAVVPHAQINLISGPMQAFQYFFQALNLQWVTPLIAGFTLVGGLAILNTWIIGPSKGLSASLEGKNLPLWYNYRNAQGVPVSLLVFQGAIATILCLVFSLSEAIQAAYWMVNILAAQLYLVMYAILFAALIKLRYSHPETPRAYKIPGQMLGVWLVGGIGCLACLLAILIGFIKPSGISMALSHQQYALSLGAAMLFFSVLPWLLGSKHL